MHIEGLRLYPIKSCQGVDVDRAYAAPRGLQVGQIIDRGWMIVDGNGDFISQRQRPELARVKVELLRVNADQANRIKISVPGFGEQILDPDFGGDGRQVIFLHKNPVWGTVAPYAAVQFFRDYLKSDVFLVYQKEGDARPCDENFAARPGKDVVSFADGYPYLVTTTATLSALNARLDAPVPMENFRANIVIASDESEYNWRGLCIGEAAIQLVKPCTRCVMTTRDQQSGEQAYPDTLTALTKNFFLTQQFGDVKVKGPVFGENAIAMRGGKISRRDTVRVTERKQPYAFRQAHPT
ncbi:MAG: MOSC domain-containing protein [Alphaproteobacteria bacterium]|nr:MOSC domain-containing protein [Alphaproteobacteria bacterium]